MELNSAASFSPLVGVRSLGTISIKQVSLKDVSKQILAPNCEQLQIQMEKGVRQLASMTQTNTVTMSTDEKMIVPRGSTNTNENLIDH